ncbi:MAG: TetR/AcrR family transcriptional regulator [Coriobacteriia bacterium]|nr:TetR/AcrR family transcriptional regulator [Actinomycetota bacterium]MDZ4166563.1 TetR/AcrR family transcriptional regulator [Coriobacteriia bacterium]
MSVRQRKDPEVRRAELVAAAAALFSERGVAATTVSDIVRAAGVAQGTFYLYFDSKDDIVCAVAEMLIDGMVARIESALDDPGRSAVEKLDAMASALVEINDEPYEIELMGIFHRPDNLAFHDSVNRSIVPRLMPHLARIIDQGVAEGSFVAEDPEKSAWFILGALQGLELGFTGTDEVRDAVGQLRAFVLRGLGHSGVPARGGRGGAA